MMSRKILIVGAGRSATGLINYLLDQAEVMDWQVVVLDRNPQLAEEKIARHPRGIAGQLDVDQKEACEAAVEGASFVISLLPPALHYRLAEACLLRGRHLATASYWSEDLLAYRPEVEARRLVFMGEMGLDPGIDHMSAMQKIDEIHAAGGKILSFKSYTGGLVAPEDDDNPWHYKISWNPRNVVTAGREGARFLEEGRVRFVPYHRIFQEYEGVEVPGWGRYEGYPNRDSLKYQQIYGLTEVRDLLRGTLRSDGFCDAWNVLVQLGITGNEWQLPEGYRGSYRDMLASFTGSGAVGNGEVPIRSFVRRGDEKKVVSQIQWLGLLSETGIPPGVRSAGEALERLLLEKWKLEGSQRDLVLMQHEFVYVTGAGERKRLLSTMALKGDDATRTAMTNLVGWPLGIFVKRYLSGDIRCRGLLIPTGPEVYEPILQELARKGVLFRELESKL